MIFLEESVSIICPTQKHTIQRTVKTIYANFYQIKTK
jgi:hypothetical protein